MTPLVVEDIEASIEFYCSSLGLFRVARDVRLGQRREVVLRHVAGTHLVALLAGSPSPFQLALGQQSWPLLVITVQDVSSVLARLARRGVAPQEEIELPYGVQAIVLDPSRNEIQLCETWDSDGD